GECLRDRRLQAGVRVGNQQLHTLQAARDAAAEEAPPERLGLALADVDADHLPVAGLVDGVGEHQRFRHDPAAVTGLLDLGTEPERGVAALQGPVAERLTLLVEAGADPGDLALGDPDPERLHHLVDLPGRNAGDLGLLHDRYQSLLAALARAPGSSGRRSCGESSESPARSHPPASARNVTGSRSSASAAPPAPARRAQRRSAPTPPPPSAAAPPRQATRAEHRVLRPRSGSRTTSSAVILLLAAIVVTPLVNFIGVKPTITSATVAGHPAGSVRRPATPR